MTGFIIEEALPVAVGLVGLVALWWLTADLQRRGREQKRARQKLGRPSCFSLDVRDAQT